MAPSPEKPASLELIIVSGISGSGKSTALRTLEDLGHYCIDNLPVDLLDACIERLLNDSHQETIRVAVGIDARNSSELAQFPALLQRLNKERVRYRTLFFNAEQSVLLKRFNETRRRHPLSRPNTTLADSIALEQEQMAPIAEISEVVDTTRLTIYELRDLIGQLIASSPEEGKLNLVFSSFGFKYGAPMDADLVFDLRCLPNPNWEPELKDQTGKDPQVIRFLEEKPLVGNMFDSIRDYLTTWAPCFESGNRGYLNIAIGCTGGRHRSVYMAERLASHFREQGKKVTVRHRELKLLKSA